ncbi:hypothetical protein OE749_08210 [Aestuariibacter sp. AA17]|uniref:Uncharacterized protein n=1 Tax=Fluctibacter corallii TaxID=2984329 RepID=A0ABT3A8S7_9ALTE|nr:hypothetical protein [Aestuariibacter sp. AA17]MCV2884677.1 hypothetical protein [Aestuariibacter sp. AA17]
MHRTKRDAQPHGDNIMRDIELPDSISKLVDHLNIVQLFWQGIPIQLPRFAVYAILDKPVFDNYFYRDGRKMALIRVDRYQIPVIDPFRGNIERPPAHVVIISHIRANRFGLYGYPADVVQDDIYLPPEHRSVKRIIRDFV